MLKIVLDGKSPITEAHTPRSVFDFIRSVGVAWRVSIRFLE